MWLITWKVRRGGEMHVREERSLWRVILWMMRNLRWCVIAVVSRLEEDDSNT